MPRLATATRSAIAADGLTKSFGGVTAVDEAALRVEPGAIVALVGPSGSGKTTLLRLIAGFERPERGTVHIDDGLVAGPGTFVEPEQRRIGMVFQHGGLFPHLSVGANVGFGARAKRHATACLELVGLGHRHDAFPHELSGGERQRIALARALAAEPAVVLLDEPFTALDASLRESLREDVAMILREAGATALLVTHDQAEALSLADTIAVMREGRVVQSGTPEQLYAHPESQWVAEFLGEVDVLPGTVTGGAVRFELGGFADDGALTGDVRVAVRPEAVAIGPEGSGDVSAVVVRRVFFGHDQLVHLELPSGVRVRSRRLGLDTWAPGDRVGVWLEGPAAVLPAREAQVPERVGAVAR